MSQTARNIGFEGRTFLHEAEWLTYRRRKPVRYIRRPRADRCSLCPKPASPNNPLQSAHIISFDMGVIELGLTPDFLDSEKNILTAHRRTCNKGCELDLIASMARLRELGEKELPQYLPAWIHEAWGREAKPRG
jgi:hypothetical protein